jgi:DNA mismatch endonuclease Vsr
MPNVLVWDIETVPDLAGFAAANGHDGKSDDEIRAELGDKFPKHIYHSIICIGALIAHKDNDHWIIDALGAPHVGERSERDLITAFVDKIAALSPQMVTFNGSSFDLPVLRYRAMVHKVPAMGLSARPYFHRYTDDAIDLCDVLSSFAPGAKLTLHELCRVMGLLGKPDLVFAGRKKIVFVHGCYWHGHGCKVGGTGAKSNRDYWGPKIARNRERERERERERQLCNGGS